MESCTLFCGQSPKTHLGPYHTVTGTQGLNAFEQDQTEKKREKIF